MQNFSSLFKEETIFLEVDEKTYEGVLKFIGKELTKLGYAKETFTDAILKREEMYPTGLPTEPVPVAIPHTDTEHVIKPCICFIRLKNSVEFHEMIEVHKTVKVNYVFCILLDDPKNQTGVLQSILSIASNSNIMNKLGKVQTTREVFKLFEGDN